MDFGQRLVGPLPELVPRLLERHRVRAGIAGLQARERAEKATGNADVGGFETDVVVVEGPAAVTLLALTVRQPADGQQIRRFEETPAVLHVEALAGVQFFRDLSEAGGVETRADLVIG